MRKATNSIIIVLFFSLAILLELARCNSTSSYLVSCNYDNTKNNCWYDECCALLTKKWRNPSNNDNDIFNVTACVKES